MILSDLFFMGFMLITAILILWFSVNYMIYFKRKNVFLPFFISGYLLILSAGLSFYGIFDQMTWFLIEFGWAILFFWIFINLRRENGSN